MLLDPVQLRVGRRRRQRVAEGMLDCADAVSVSSSAKAGLAVCQVVIQETGFDRREVPDGYDVGMPSVCYVPCCP